MLIVGRDGSFLLANLEANWMFGRPESLAGVIIETLLTDLVGPNIDTKPVSRARRSNNAARVDSRFLTWLSFGT